MHDPTIDEQHISFPSKADLEGQISRLFIYPIKSCAGIEVHEAQLVDTGLLWDRTWMLVDSSGEFLTQRELPRMTLIQPHIQSRDLVVRAPGMQQLRLPLGLTEETPCRVRVWKDEVDAFDMGNAASEWFSHFLAVEKGRFEKLRLVRYNLKHKRLSNKRWTGDLDALNQFSDGYPINILSQASLDELNTRLFNAGQKTVCIERFRPNIVISGIEAHDEDRCNQLLIGTPETAKLALVKPCERCPIPNVNPITALPSPEVGLMMQSYRHDARVGGAVTFGMNAAMIVGLGSVLIPGQRVAGNITF